MIFAFIGGLGGNRFRCSCPDTRPRASRLGVSHPNVERPIADEIWRFELNPHVDLLARIRRGYATNGYRLVVDEQLLTTHNQSYV